MLSAGQIHVQPWLMIWKPYFLTMHSLKPIFHCYIDYFFIRKIKLVKEKLITLYFFLNYFNQITSKVFTALHIPKALNEFTEYFLYMRFLMEIEIHDPFFSLR